MAFLSGFAVYFVIWWLTLFVVLPFGLRTQGEEQSVVPGTVESAPARFRALRVVLLTSAISATVYGGWLILNNIFGIGFDDLPHIL
eukprot:gene52490-71592_t